jgi:hypothetical protein
MKPASSGRNTIPFLSRLALALIATTVLAFAGAPGLHAQSPPDQVKAAGAIPLTTDLLDSMDEVIKAIDADNAAKAELAVIGKDSSLTPETWAAAVTSKCPKAAAHFTEAEITPDEFGKAIYAIMACAMGDDLAKSDDKAVKANAEFVAANKSRAEAVFGSFMKLQDPGASSAP